MQIEEVEWKVVLFYFSKDADRIEGGVELEQIE